MANPPKFDPYAPYSGSTTTAAPDAKPKEKVDPYAPYKPPSDGADKTDAPMTLGEKMGVGAAVGAGLNMLTPTEDVQLETKTRREAMKGKSSMTDLNREINEQKRLVDMKHGKGFFEAAMQRSLAERARGMVPNSGGFDPFLGRLDDTNTYARERQTGFGMGTKDVWAAAREGDEAAKALVASHLAGNLSAEELNRYSAPVKRILVDPRTQEAVIAARDLKASTEATDLYKGLNRYNQKLDLEAALPTYRGNTSRGLSAPIGVAGAGAGTKTRAMLVGALGGLGLPFQAEEISERMGSNDPIGATIAGIGAAGDVAAMMPTRPNPYQLAVKGAGMLAGAASPLVLMAYDKFGPDILPYLVEKGIISPDMVPANFSVMNPKK